MSKIYLTVRHRSCGGLITFRLQKGAGEALDASDGEEREQELSKKEKKRLRKKENKRYPQR